MTLVEPERSALASALARVATLVAGAVALAMRSLRWSWPVLAVALVVFVPWACYVEAAARRIELCVLDKTVPFRNWFEHRSLYWLLLHLNVVKADGTNYAVRARLHRGVPARRPGRPAGAHARPYDRRRREGAPRLPGGHVRRLPRRPEEQGAHGGRARAQPEALRRADARKKPARPRARSIPGRRSSSEFDTLGSPTGRRRSDDARGRARGPLDPLDRALLRSARRRTSEVPQWMRNDYEREWKQPWRFEGPGYVLVQDDVHCEVLRVGLEADAIGLTIERERPDRSASRSCAPTASRTRTGSTSSRTDPRRSVWRRFTWHLKDAGRERLKARGLKERFPAVTRRTPPRGGAAWYFAGDFADNPMDPRPVPFLGYLAFRHVVEGLKLAPSETAFYWRFYVPMMETILSDAESSR